MALSQNMLGRGGVSVGKSLTRHRHHTSHHHASSALQDALSVSWPPCCTLSRLSVSISHHYNEIFELRGGCTGAIRQKS